MNKPNDVKNHCVIQMMDSLTRHHSSQNRPEVAPDTQLKLPFFNTHSLPLRLEHKTNSLIRNLTTTLIRLVRNYLLASCKLQRRFLGAPSGAVEIRAHQDSRRTPGNVNIRTEMLDSSQGAPLTPLLHQQVVTKKKSL